MYEPHKKDELDTITVCDIIFSNVPFDNTKEAKAIETMANKIIGELSEPTVSVVKINELFKAIDHPSHAMQNYRLDVLNSINDYNHVVNELAK